MYQPRDLVSLPCLVISSTKNDVGSRNRKSPESIQPNIIELFDTGQTGNNYQAENRSVKFSPHAKIGCKANMSWFQFAFVHAHILNPPKSISIITYSLSHTHPLFSSNRRLFSDLFWSHPIRNIQQILFIFRLNGHAHHHH